EARRPGASPAGIAASAADAAAEDAADAAAADAVASDVGVQHPFRVLALVGFDQLGETAEQFLGARRAAHGRELAVDPTQLPVDLQGRAQHVLDRHPRLERRVLEA